MSERDVHCSLAGFLHRVLLRFHGKNMTARGGVHKGSKCKVEEGGGLMAKPQTEDADITCIRCRVVARAVTCPVAFEVCCGKCLQLQSVCWNNRPDIVCQLSLTSNLHQRRRMSYCVSSQSVDSSLGGLSRSSTVASLDTDSTKSSGQSNNLDTCAEFRIKYVGAIEKLDLSQGKSLQGPLDLINYIDVAQQDGKLPFVPLEEEFILGVSKYGIKVSTTDQHGVLHRHALYLIIRMVCYDDGLGAGKSLLALKTTDASNEEYSLWVYQCNSLEQAQAICKVLSTAFDSVLTSTLDKS